MAFPDRRTSNVLLTILLFATIFAILYGARRVLLIFVFAILFAYLIDPVVSFLQRHSLFFKNLRGPHVVAAYLALLLLAGLASHGVAPLVSGHAARVLTELPALLDSVATGDIATTIGDRQRWTEDGKLQLRAFLVGHGEDIKSLRRGAEQFVANALVVLVSVPILAVFFLADGRRIADAFIHVVSTEGNRETIREAADELNIMLSRYLRANVILVACSLVFYSAALLSLKFPYPIVLGVLGGVLVFIPAAGCIGSAAIILGVGMHSDRHSIWMAVLLGLWRITMDYVIAPRVVGQNLAIHPLMVLFGIMVGGEIGGIVGIYLSIPLMVVFRVIWRWWISPTALTSLAS